MISRILAGLGLVGMCFGVAAAGDYKCKASTQECLDLMSSKLKTMGWVGIEFEPDALAAVGYQIIKVVPGSPADKAGLHVGDTLYALNGVTLSREKTEAQAKARKEWTPGQAITYTVRRGGTDREITLTLAPMPADVMAKWIGEHMMGHAQMERAAIK